MIISAKVRDWSWDGPEEDGRTAYKIGCMRMGPRYSTRKTVRHPSCGPAPDGGQWSVVGKGRDKGGQRLTEIFDIDSALFPETGAVDR